MKVFDFHTHIFPDELAERALAKLAYTSKIMPFSDGTLSGTAAVMHRDGIDGFLTLHTATNARQTESVNRFALQVEKSGGAQAFGSVYPKSPDAVDTLIRLHETGFKGIKLHPEYQDFDFDDPAVFPVYEICRDYNLLLLFHAGKDLAFPDSLRASVSAVKKIAKNFPGLRLIAAHFGGFALGDEVLMELAGQSDLYFDTSCSVGVITSDLAGKIINRHGAEKILFGSDCPWGSPAAHVKFIDGMKISARDKDLIFYQNAHRLLNFK